MARRSLASLAIVLPLLQAAPAHAHPVPRSNHDRVIRVRLTQPGDGHRVVPGRDDCYDASRLGHHHVGGGPAALQGAAPVERPEFGVLAQGRDARLHPAAAELRALFGDGDIRSLLEVPLRLHGHNVGTVTFGQRGVRRSWTRGSGSHLVAGDSPAPSSRASSR